MIRSWVCVIFFPSAPYLIPPPWCLFNVHGCAATLFYSILKLVYILQQNSPKLAKTAAIGNFDHFWWTFLAYSRQNASAFRNQTLQNVFPQVSPLIHSICGYLKGDTFGKKINLTVGRDPIQWKPHVLFWSEIAIFRVFGVLC